MRLRCCLAPGPAQDEQDTHSQCHAVQSLEGPSVLSLCVSPHLGFKSHLKRLCHQKAVPSIPRQSWVSSHPVSSKLTQGFALFLPTLSPPACFPIGLSPGCWSWSTRDHESFASTSVYPSQRRGSCRERSLNYQNEFLGQWRSSIAQTRFTGTAAPKILRCVRTGAQARA